MKLLTKVDAFFDRSIDVFAVVAAVILVFLWGLLSTEVIIRFLVNYSIIWTIEISEISLMAITFLGAAWVLKKDRHVRVDIVYSRLKPRSQVLLSVFTSIIGAVICAFLVWYGMKVTIDDFQRGILIRKIMRMLQWPIYATISLGSLLLFIQFCRMSYKNLQLWRVLGGK